MTKRWWTLGPRDWFEVAKMLRYEARHDSAPVVAAGVAFYLMLAMIPALVIAVSVYGLFTEIGEAERQVDALLQVLPEATALTLESQIRPIADLSHGGLGFGVVVSAVALIWTTSNATRAMIRAVVIAYDQEHLRSPLEHRVAAIGLTAGLIVAGLIALALIAAAPIWLRRFDPTHAIVTFGNARWLLIAVGMSGGVALLYRFAPPRRPESWLAVVPGVVTATLLWVAMSIGFSIYVASFSNYNQTYGVLGAAVVLLLWFWLTSLAVIIGAELNEVLEVREEPPSV